MCSPSQDALHITHTRRRRQCIPYIPYYRDLDVRMSDLSEILTYAKILGFDIFKHNVSMNEAEAEAEADIMEKQQRCRSSAIS